MAEIRPVIGQVGSNERFSSSNRQNNQDPFSITGDVVTPAKVPINSAAAEAKNQMQQQQSNMLMELSRGILKPINQQTNIQSTQLRELVAASKLLEASSDRMSGQLMEKIFISPEELQAQLMSQDRGETSFSGEAFDILRLISKLNTNPSDATSAAKLAQMASGQSGQAGAIALAQAAVENTQTKPMSAAEALNAANAAALAEEAATGEMLAGAAMEGLSPETLSMLMDGDEIDPALAQTLAEMDNEAVVTDFGGKASEAARAAAETAGTAVNGAGSGFAGSLSQAVSDNQMLGGNLDIQNSLVSILRHFDCYTNQDQSLAAISQQLADLQGRVFTSDRPVIQDFINQLNELMKATMGESDGQTNAYSQVQAALDGVDVLSADQDAMDQTQAFLKGDLVPTLSRLVSKYHQTDSVRNPVMSIIHYVTRYDKADPEKLKGAVNQLADALQDIQGLNEQDIEELKNLILDAARDTRVDQKIANVEKDFLGKFGATPETKNGDIAGVLSQSLDGDNPAKVQKLAMNLLNTMVDSESPVMPLMHFMVPIEYNGAATYLEMYVDKNCESRKGKADSAVNIFFTIDSEDYGTFEVDLLARDKMIDLDIKAPGDLQKEIRAAKNNIRAAVEESGFRLALYRVATYSHSTSAASHFSELKAQASGLDVKV